MGGSGNKSGPARRESDKPKKSKRKRVDDDDDEDGDIATPKHDRYGTDDEPL